MTGLPTRSQIEGWRSDHLSNAAKVWGDRAAVLSDAFAKAQRTLDDLPWSGAAAEQARARLREDMAKISAALDLLRKGEEIARTGAEAIDAAKQDALDAIDEAERQLFTVNEDLTLTDRIPPLLLGPFAWLRRLLQKMLEAEIRGRAQALADADARVADELKPIAAQLRDFVLGGAPGGPAITGPAGPLVYEQDDYDLQVTWPDGEGPTLGGDPQTHEADWTPVGQEVPRDADSEKADLDDKTRPIPTGTAIGPNGERYAFFSYPDGSEQEGINPYSTPGKAWDFSDPDHPRLLGDVTYPGPDGHPLPVYQPSGAYDKTTGQMVIVGNTTNGSGKIERVMFTSDPIKPGDAPNKWLETLKPASVVQGLPGARENQLVALEGGGFALVGSDNFDPSNPSARPPVSAVVASSAEDLLTATPTTLVGPTDISGKPAAPYGPTVIDTVYDPVTGQETIQLRVSTWDGVNYRGRDQLPYDPQTYTTSITVQH
jgi:hypothetical protein